VSKQREVAMRLITHNMLSCNIKGVTNGYPLGIEASRLETKESELNPEFLRKIFPKLEWKALRDAAHSLGLNDLPEHVEPSMLEDEDFLKNFHHALLEVSLPILLFLVAMLASQQMSFDHYNIVQFLT
jgi:multifunctional methyltransferase subunit TRM112